MGLSMGDPNNVAEQYPEVLNQIKEIMNKARTESEVYKF